MLSVGGDSGTLAKKRESSLASVRFPPFLPLQFRPVPLTLVESCPTLVPPWTVAHQASPSMGFFQARILEWVSFPSPGHLPDPGNEPGFYSPGSPGGAQLPSKLHHRPCR